MGTSMYYSMGTIMSYYPCGRLSPEQRTEATDTCRRQKTRPKKKNTAGRLRNALPCLVASLSNALTPSRLPCCCETRPAGSPTFVFYRPHAKWACLSATPLLDTPFPAAQSPLRHPTLRRLSSSPSALLSCRLFFSFLPAPL